MSYLKFLMMLLVLGVASAAQIGCEVEGDVDDDDASLKVDTD